MRTKSHVIFLTLALLGGSCGEAEEMKDPEPGVQQEEGGRVSVTEEADNRLAGGFSRGGAMVVFEATSVSPSVSNASITVNGKRFTVSRDVQSGRALWSGGGATLTPEDRTTMLAFDGAMVTRNKSRSALAAHEDLLGRLSALIAEAPLGTQFMAQEVEKPKEGVTDTRSDPGTLACQQADEDGILYFASCQVGDRTICHDAGGHCFVCERHRTGYGSAVDCAGRCGPGCGLPPPVGGHGPYTYDCADHDECGRVHGGSGNPWDSECGDEYWEADDDFLWGRQNC